MAAKGGANNSIDIAQDASLAITRLAPGGPFDEEQALAPAYRAGLAALDALARSRLARDFAALDAAQQVSLLEQLEDGKLEPWPAAAGAQAALFGTLRLHTLLGFLAAPAFGGNRDGAGWKAVGHVGHLHGAGGVSDDQVTGASP